VALYFIIVLVDILLSMLVKKFENWSAFGKLEAKLVAPFFQMWCRMGSFCQYLYKAEKYARV